MAAEILGLYPIDLQMLEDEQYLRDSIYPNMRQEYYWSKDFSPDFYIAQAKAGFIAICETVEGEELLLPEIQQAYALLDFEDLHISSHVAKHISRRDFTLTLSSSLDDIAAQIDAQHQNNWLSAAYLETLKSTEGIDENFKALSVSLVEDGVLVAGEIGYGIGSTYTSLSGFSSRQKQHRDYGKVQMVLLAQLLRREGFSFWNLGHPYMPYKTALGAKRYARADFLQRWYPAALGKEFAPYYAH